tara:strand:+ start:1274 stop:1915 length:642 start_codon:yes stop_codon:yes gene_type:complete
MEREQIKLLLQKINVAHNKCYDKFTKDQKTQLIDMFFSHLKYYDNDDVEKAFYNYESENEYTPKPAHLRKELNYMNAKKKHYINESNHIKHDDFDKVTRQSLQDLLIDEYCPVLKMNIMNIDENKRDFILSRANKMRYSIMEFINQVWNYISETSDICNYHLQIAINSVRGTKVSIKDFMREILNAHDLSEKLKDEEVINNLKKEYIKSTVKS